MQMSPQSLWWRHNEHNGVSNHQHIIVYSTVCSGADQRKHQSSKSLAFMRGIRRWSLNSPNKGPITRINVSIWWRHHGAWFRLGLWRDSQIVHWWVTVNLIFVFILIQWYYPEKGSKYPKHRRLNHKKMKHDHNHDEVIKETTLPNEKWRHTATPVLHMCTYYVHASWCRVVWKRISVMVCKIGIS